MARTTEVHRLRSGLVLVMFGNARPVATLFGDDAVELTTIGRMWVDAELKSTKSNLRSHRGAKPVGLPWNGTERRHHGN